jgi:hypothetical protein
MPASLNLPIPPLHPRQPSRLFPASPTAKLLVTRPCKRPSRSRSCSSAVQLADLHDEFQTVSWIPMPFSAPVTCHTRTRVLLTVKAECEMRNGPKIAHIKVFLAPIPSNSSKLSRIGEILLANVAGVLQTLMCACLGCEVATIFFFSFWKQ